METGRRIKIVGGPYEGRTGTVVTQAQIGHAAGGPHEDPERPGVLCKCTGPIVLVDFGVDQKSSEPRLGPQQYVEEAFLMEV